MAEHNINIRRNKCSELRPRQVPIRALFHVGAPCTKSSLSPKDKRVAMSPDMRTCSSLPTSFARRGGQDRSAPGIYSSVFRDYLEEFRKPAAPPGPSYGGPIFVKPLALAHPVAPTVIFLVF